MESKSILYGIIGLLLGVGITTYAASSAVNNGNANMMRMMGINTAGGMMNTREQATHGGMGMGSSMDDMMASMNQETGDAFDAAFIEAMIVHHQGAINMARLAQENASHNELKTLSNDIIDAQTREINQMISWQTQWGY